MIKLTDILKEVTAIATADFSMPLQDFLDKYNQEVFPGITPKDTSLTPHGVISIGSIDPSEYDTWEEVIALPREREKIEKLADKVRQGIALPPILLSMLKGYRGSVVDGHHRVAANIVAGKREVEYVLDLESLIDMWLDKNHKSTTYKAREELLQNYLSSK